MAGFDGLDAIISTLTAQIVKVALEGILAKAETTSALARIRRLKISGLVSAKATFVGKV